LADLDVLIKTGYHSPDLQFMVDNNGGGLYVMDMEPLKAPRFDGRPDPQLLKVKAEIEAALKGQAAPIPLGHRAMTRALGASQGAKSATNY
jgi:hypothetical protein